MNPVVVRVHEDEGIHTGLMVTEGPKFIGVIWPDATGMKINKLRKSASTRINELIDYPVKQAKVILRRCGKNFGITKSAKRYLK